MDQDLSEIIERLQEIAKFLQQHPFLAQLQFGGNPVIDVFPDSMTPELVKYFRDERIDFVQVPLREGAHAICIAVGGLQFYISNWQIANLSEEDMAFILGGASLESVVTTHPTDEATLDIDHVPAHARPVLKDHRVGSTVEDPDKTESIDRIRE